MTEIITIELAQNNSVNLNNKNSDYVVSIPPIKIDTGDAVVFQNGFLKVAQLDQTQMYIDQDTTVRISFGYYMANCFKNTFANTATPTVPNDTPDFLYYVLYQCGNPPTFTKTVPIISYIETTILKGYYYPDDLANQITKAFSTIPPQTNLEYQNIYDIGEFYSGSDLSINITSSEQPKNIDYSNPPLRCFSRADFIGGPTGTDFTIPDAGWDALGFVGATQFELSFDPTISKFEFNYLHTPFIKGGAQQVVVNYLDPKLVFTENISGVFLNDLSPPNFWELLGFDSDLCTMKVGSFSDAQLQKSTCFTEVGISYLQSYLASKPPVDGPASDENRTGDGDVLNPFYPVVGSDVTPPSDPEIFYVESQNTIPLIAENTYTPSLNSSFFKIDIEFGLAVNLVKTQNKSFNLNCISSKQWLQDQIINIFSDSSIPYIHNSPFSEYLTQFRVRILNQDNELIQLSEGSVLYMRVIKSDANANASIQSKGAAALNK